MCAGDVPAVRSGAPAENFVAQNGAAAMVRLLMIVALLGVPEGRPSFNDQTTVGATSIGFATVGAMSPGIGPLSVYLSSVSSLI